MRGLRAALVLATSSPCTSAPGQAPPRSCSVHVPGHSVARPGPCHCKVVAFPGPSSSAVSCRPPLGSTPWHPGDPARCVCPGTVLWCCLGQSLGWSSSPDSSALLPGHRAAPGRRWAPALIVLVPRRCSVAAPPVRVTSGSLCAHCSAGDS